MSNNNRKKYPVFSVGCIFSAKPKNLPFLQNSVEFGTSWRLLLFSNSNPSLWSFLTKLLILLNLDYFSNQQNSTATHKNILLIRYNQSINLYYARRQHMQKHTTKTNTNYKLNWQQWSKKRPEGPLNIKVTRMPRQYVICRRKSLNLIKIQTKKQWLLNIWHTE